ncbi:MAG: hypothetical protein H6Q72_166 [Firmicutes bacterium]|nr:hypothetical protein [Bacillota bacterium]
MEYKKIYDLREEMVNLGYTDLEVDEFIYDAIGNTSIDKLTKQEFKDLIRFLESYISHARKSL